MRPSGANGWWTYAPGCPRSSPRGGVHPVRGAREAFAYYLEDHHGDGRIAVCCNAPPDVQEALVATDPERFYLPAYLARYGWISLRLDLPALGWEEVSEFVVDSYRLVAPKRLAAVAAEAIRA